MALEIHEDDLQGSAIKTLLEEHIEDMRSTSPPESKHALDLDELKQPDILFWSAYLHAKLVGCIALKLHEDGWGEIKSMRTVDEARGRGVASQLVVFLIENAKSRGVRQLYLETGAMDFFKPARLLYEKHGFSDCGPFADYKLDPNSVFMHKAL
jgi:putative acetyltransferase